MKNSQKAKDTMPYQSNYMQKLEYIETLFSICRCSIIHMCRLVSAHCSKKVNGNTMNTENVDFQRAETVSKPARVRRLRCSHFSAA